MAIQRWTQWLRRPFGAGSLEIKGDVNVKLIAGLGNPGSGYENTRHNVGFMVIDALAGRFGMQVKRKKFNALIEEVSAENTRLLLLKPQEYMNRSGHAIATASGFYKLTPADLLVVTDDMALETGRLRLRAQGSAGGHNGLKDIILKLGTDQFSRLRVGIGDSGPMDAADYVLSRFSSEERDIVDKAVQAAVDAVLCWVREGVEPAMTRYNATNK